MSLFYLFRFLSEVIGGETNIYAIEASMHGFLCEDEKTIHPYSEEDCELN